MVDSNTGVRWEVQGERGRRGREDWVKKDVQGEGAGACVHRCRLGVPDGGVQASCWSYEVHANP